MPWGNGQIATGPFHALKVFHLSLARRCANHKEKTNTAAGGKYILHDVTETHGKHVRGNRAGGDGHFRGHTGRAIIRECERYGTLYDQCEKGCSRVGGMRMSSQNAGQGTEPILANILFQLGHDVDDMERELILQKTTFERTGNNKIVRGLAGISLKLCTTNYKRIWRRTRRPKTGC